MSYLKETIGVSICSYRYGFSVTVGEYKLTLICKWIERESSPSNFPLYSVPSQSMERSHPTHKQRQSKIKNSVLVLPQSFNSSCYSSTALVVLSGWGKLLRAWNWLKNLQGFRIGCKTLLWLWLARTGTRTVALAFVTKVGWKSKDICRTLVFVYQYQPFDFLFFSFVFFFLLFFFLFFVLVCQSCRGLMW